jgi:hypothetical protein
MADFFELASKYERSENALVNTFTMALKRQIEAFDSSNFTKRSWVKEDGGGFVVKLGKLEKSYNIPSRDEVSEFLHSALSAAQGNEDFRTMVEEAYGEKQEEQQTKPKRKYTRRNSV